MNLSSAEWVDPIKIQLANKQVFYSVPPPGSGVLAGYILNILDSYLPLSGPKADDTDPLTYHRIVESFKHAYAQRTKLADPRFEPQVYDVSLVQQLINKINTTNLDLNARSSVGHQSDF